MHAGIVGFVYAMARSMNVRQPEDSASVINEPREEALTTGERMRTRV